MDTMAELRDLAADRPGRGADRGDALAQRLPRGARGGADDRGPGQDREPRAAGGGRARVRRQPTAPPTARREGSQDFLAEIALVADADQRSDDEGLVTLMTLHNAKGLEYPTVFIVGCEDGVFPHSRTVEEGGLEEERRLFYVGVTRAMRSLYLTHARRRALFGAQSYGLRSRFLDEIPAELRAPPGRAAAAGRGARAPARDPCTAPSPGATAATAATPPGTPARAARVPGSCPASASARTSSTPPSATGSSPGSSRAV